jgi:hypothetical protein
MTSACLSQIIGTAVVDGGFRSALLSNPNRALARFKLDSNELAGIASIRASTIEQFAEQLIVWMNDHSVD